MAEQAQRLTPQLQLPPQNLTSADAAMTWRQLAIREYREAYRLSDVPVSHILDRALVVESGQALIATLRSEIEERRSRQPLKQDETFIADAEKEIAAVQPDLDRINRLPRAVTPLVFSTHPDVRLCDLLSTATVTFDLDGFTEGRSWHWLQPETAMLVWDPARQGRIVSGRQLFGSVTWWMFWKNGFGPLAALDDNGDSWLTGEELEGISVWQDRNGNGVSDAGEVTPAREFGIIAISVRPADELDGVPANRNGVIMRDGRSLTLFDWIPVSIDTSDRISLSLSRR